MTPGARSKFDAPMFEPEVFQKESYCVEESTCDIVGTFRPTQRFGVRTIVPPSPLVTPLAMRDKYTRKSFSTFVKEYFKCTTQWLANECCGASLSREPC